LELNAPSSGLLVVYVNAIQKYIRLVAPAAGNVTLACDARLQGK
jgi:hypothetical protein